MDDPQPGEIAVDSRRQWSVFHRGKARTLNAERRGHWRAHRAATTEEREAFGWEWRQRLSMGRRPIGLVEVEATPHATGNLQDAGNCYPSVKAAIDAAVDVGLLIDDGPAYVARVILNAPIRSTPPGLMVTIREVGR